MYYRHIHLGHTVRATDYPVRGDVFAGIVVASDDENRIEVDTYSTVWMKNTFVPVASLGETNETLKHDIDVLRVLLGVESEPAATLAARMQDRAARCGRIYQMVVDWAHE